LDLIEREPYHYPVGRTRFQKIAYFATALGIPTGLTYRRSSYGPFAEELKGNVLTKLVNNGLIKEESQGWMFILRTGPACKDALLQYQTRDPYGPSLFPTEESQEFLLQYPETLKNYAKEIQFVAEKIGTLGVAELERLATALYVTFNENGQRTSREDRITELKPHIKIDEAREAVKNVDAIRREVRTKGLGSL
jgi:hypothetical protein